MKDILKNINKVPLEIVNLLSQDKEILNLLYNDNPNVLEQLDAEVDIQKLFDYEYIQLFSPLATEINHYKTNLTLSVLLDEINFFEPNIGATVRIYVSCSNDLIKLTNNENRLLSLVSKIVTSLQNTKLSCAGMTKLDSVDYVIVNENRSGYRINLFVSDQQPKQVEI